MTILNDNDTLEAGRSAGLSDEQVKEVRDLCVKYAPDGIAYYDESFWNLIGLLKEFGPDTAAEYGTT